MKVFILLKGIHQNIHKTFHSIHVVQEKSSYRNKVVFLHTDHISHLNVHPLGLLKAAENLFIFVKKKKSQNYIFFLINKDIHFKGFIFNQLQRRHLCSHLPFSKTSHLLLLISLSILCRAWGQWRERNQGCFKWSFVEICDCVSLGWGEGWDISPIYKRRALKKFREVWVWVWRSSCRNSHQIIHQVFNSCDSQHHH